MSFLNPVNEPVLRFSSTDVGAPQINHNARAAGDVKAVLKACLVTGYGAKSSAGWSIVNEVNNVAEFVSPSVAMSDYRLGIDDTSTANTTWYYQYQNSRVNPVNNVSKKSLIYITKTSPRNGWEVLVTNLGFFLVEKLYNPDVTDTVARLTYFGRVKSTSLTNSGENIAFWCAGHGSGYNPYQLFSGSTASYFNVGGTTNIAFSAANITGLSTITKTYIGTSIDVLSNIYLYSGVNIVAEHPALIAKDSANNVDLYGVRDDVVALRDCLYVCLGRETAVSNLESSVRVLMIYLDYWEY